MCYSIIFHRLKQEEGNELVYYRDASDGSSCRRCLRRTDLDRMDPGPNLGGTEGEDVSDVTRDAGGNAVQGHQVDWNAHCDRGSML